MVNSEQKHIDAYPLCWPDGWPRRGSHASANFSKSERVVNNHADGSTSSWNRKKSLSVLDGMQRVLDELGRMGLDRDDIVISSNLRTRLDGLPAANAPEPMDPGVAVYWRVGKATRCMAIDRYNRTADNMAAIAATLNAMRAVERHGGAEILDRAFTGFTALPMPEQWFQVLGVKSTSSRDEIDSAYRALAMKHHPDRGGDANEMARINTARDAGLEQLGAV